MYTSTKISFESFPDDGFGVVAAEPWFKVKVQVIQQYLQSFVAQVAGRVDEIIFVDLFAGSGCYCSGYQREMFAGPALACMALGLPINRWILCESDPEAFNMLKIRVNRYFKGQNVLLQEGRQKDVIEKFRYYVPVAKKGFKVATFCVIDPFSLAMDFALIEKLTAMNFTFVIPYTFPLNGRIDFQYYLDTQRDKLTAYLRNMDSLKDVNSNTAFYKRVVQTHQRNMLSVGLQASLSHHKLESKLMDLPVYNVGFFSRQFPAKAVERDVRASTTKQFQLFS